MNKTFYAVKLNKNLNKYLAFTNTKNDIATASQDYLDYAIFFETEEKAISAIEAYLNNPNCKMFKQNRKFISVEPFEFEYQFNQFPFINSYTMVDKTGLISIENCKFSGVHIEYGDYHGRGFICSKAYKRLMKHI